MSVDSVAVSPSDTPAKHRWISARVAVSIAYVSGSVMSATDVHIVNVALPSISRAFVVPLASVQWTAIAYALSLGSMTPVSGWLADRFGSKRVYLSALMLFSVSSALCGLAPNLPSLVAFRALQGVGGGMLIPVGMIMLWRTYPPSERARVTRAVILPILVAPAIAPVLGGLIVEKLSWRWVFFINVPIGVAALVFSVLFLSEHREGTSGRFDMLGFVLSGSGVALVLYGLSEGSLIGWRSARVLFTSTIGLLVLAAFIVAELRRHHPMLKLRLFADRMYRTTNLASSLNLAALFGVLFLTPIFLQEVRGLSPLNSGLTTFPEAVGVMLGSQTIGRLYGRVGPRLMMAAGSLAFGIPLVLFVLVGASTNIWVVRGLMFALGLLDSAFIVSTQTAMFTSISRADTGQGSALSNALRQVSLSAGIAILTTVTVVVHGNRFQAFHIAYLTAAGFAFGAGVISATLIRTADAHATMIGRGG